MVSFSDAVKMFFSRYTDFQGRSRRSEYWWVALFNFLVQMAAIVLIAILGMIGSSNGEPGPLAMIPMGLLVLYALATIIPSLALIVRRLHDVNLTGWILLGALVPFLNIIVGLGIFIICFIPGTVGPNKYGDDPKNPTAGAADAFV